MASYEVTSADGQIYDIEGPEGLSDQEIISAVQSKISMDNPLPEIDRTQEAAQLQDEDVSTFGDIFKGVGAGIVNAVSGTVSLPLELIDYASRDSDDTGPGLAGASRDIFETITPTTRTGAGNAVKFITQFIAPGTVAAKLAAAKNLGKLGQAGAFAAADVAATTPDVETLGDFFDGGPTQRIDTEDLLGSELAAANLANRFKVAAEGTALLLGGPAVIKAVAKGAGPVVDEIAKLGPVKAAAEGIRANLLDNVGPMASLENPTFLSKNIRNARNKIRESKAGKYIGERVSYKGGLPDDNIQNLRHLKIQSVSAGDKQARRSIEELNQGLETLNKNGLLNDYDQAKLLDGLNDYVFATSKGKSSRETVRSNGENILKSADQLFKQVDNKKIKNKIYGTKNLFGKDKGLSLFESAKKLRTDIDGLSEGVIKSLDDGLDGKMLKGLQKVIDDNMKFYGRTVYRAGRDKSFDPMNLKNKSGAIDEKKLAKYEAAVETILSNTKAGSREKAEDILSQIYKKVSSDGGFSNPNMKPKDMFDDSTLQGITNGILKDRSLDNMPAIRDFLGEYSSAKNIYGVIGRTKQKNGSFKNSYGKIREQTLEEQKIGFQFKVSETVNKMSNLIEQTNYYKNLKSYNDDLIKQGNGKQFLFDKKPDIKLGNFERIGNVKINKDGTQSLTDESIMRYGPLAGKFVSSENIRAFTDIPSYINFAEVNKLYATFLGLKGMSQIAKTVYSPITQIRNATTAALFAVKNGNFGNGEDLVNSAQVVFQNINDNIAFSRKAAEFKASGKKIATKKDVDDYYDDMVRRGIVNTNSKIGEFEDLMGDASKFGYQSDISLFGKKINPLEIAKNTQNRFAGKLYQGSDDIWKIYSYEMELGRLKSALKNSMGDAAKGIAPSNFNIKSYDAENILKYGDGPVDLKKMSALPPETVIKNGKEEIITGEMKTLEFLKKESASIVKDTVPNYSRVPEFIKRLRQWPFGNFIAFPAEVLRTSGNIYGRAIRDLASESPEIRAIGMRRLMGAMTVDVTLPAGLVTAGLTLTGSKQEQIDAYTRSVAADYDKNSVLIPIATDKDGNITEMYNFSYTNPYDYLTRPGRAVYNAVNNGIKSEKELTSIMFDASIDAGKEFFSPFTSESIITEKAVDIVRNQTRYGRNVWNEADPLGLRISKGFAHFADGLTPGISPVRFKGATSGQDIQVGDFTLGLNVGDFTKSLGLSAGLIDPINGVNRQGYVIDPAGKFAEALTGLKSIKPRTERALMYRGYEAGNLVREASGIFNRIAKSKSNVSPEATTKAYISSNEQRFKGLRDLYMAIEDARTLGLSESEIYRALKEAKTPNLDMVMAGKFKPFFPSDETIDLVMESKSDKVGNKLDFGALGKSYSKEFGKDFLPMEKQRQREERNREIEEIVRQRQAMPTEIQMPETTASPPLASPGIAALRQAEIDKLTGI